MTDIQCVDCGKCHLGECQAHIQIGRMTSFDADLKKANDYLMGKLRPVKPLVSPLHLIEEAIGQSPRITVTIVYDNSGWQLKQEFRAIGTNEPISQDYYYADTEELIKGIKGIYGER